MFGRGRGISAHLKMMNNVIIVSMCLGLPKKSAVLRKVIHDVIPDPRPPDFNDYISRPSTSE